MLLHEAIELLNHVRISDRGDGIGYPGAGKFVAEDQLPRHPDLLQHFLGGVHVVVSAVDAARDRLLHQSGNRSVAFAHNLSRSYELLVRHGRKSDGRSEKVKLVQTEGGILRLDHRALDRHLERIAIRNFFALLEIGAPVLIVRTLEIHLPLEKGRQQTRDRKNLELELISLGGGEVSQEIAEIARVVVVVLDGIGRWLDLFHADDEIGSGGSLGREGRKEYEDENRLARGVTSS